MYFTCTAVFISRWPLLDTALPQSSMPAEKAGIYAADVATYSRTLNMLYANITAPGLRLCSSQDDLPYLKEVRR